MEIMRCLSTNVFVQQVGLPNTLSCVECGVKTDTLLLLRFNPKDQSMTPIGGTYCMPCAAKFMEMFAEAFAALVNLTIRR